MHSNSNDRQKKDSPTSIATKQPPSEPTVNTPSDDQPKDAASDVKRTPSDSPIESRLVNYNGIYQLGVDEFPVDDYLSYYDNISRIYK